MDYIVRDNELYHWGILGMKWGVRRYQNKDGSYTEAGKKRKEKEKLKNEARKKENRMSDEAVNDVNRWVKEDLTNQRQAATLVSQAASQTKQVMEKVPSKKTKRLDLSKATDKELRDKINRELLERQYNNLFNEPKISKGRETVNKVLDTVGNIAALTSSALGLALVIKELRG